MEWAEIRDQIAAHIEKSGQAVQVVYVAADDPPGRQPFMYTIGNHERGLPELLIVGTSDPAFADVLNRLGHIQRGRGIGFADEELVSVCGRFPLRVVDAGEIGRREYATFVGIYYDTDLFEVRQVLLPDTHGRWPDSPECDAHYRNQPILSRVGRTSH